MKTKRWLLNLWLVAVMTMVASVGHAKPFFGALDTISGGGGGGISEVRDITGTYVTDAASVADDTSAIAIQLDGFDVTNTVARLVVAHDSKGTITGAGSFTLLGSVGMDSNTLPYSLTFPCKIAGTVSSVGTTMRVSYVMTGTGRIKIGEPLKTAPSFAFNGKMKIKGEYDPDTNAIIGTGSLVVVAGGETFDIDVSNFSQAFVDSSSTDNSKIDGAWTLDIDMTSPIKAVSTISVNNSSSGGQRVFAKLPTTVLYTARTGQSTFTIKSVTKATQGIKVIVALTPDGTIVRITGTILGQGVKVEE